MNSLKGGGYISYLIGGFVIFNIIWHLLSVASDMSALPSPLTVYMSVGAAIDHGILNHAWASLGRVMAGLIISFVLAIIIGIAMGYNSTINKILGPSLYLSYPIPKLALLPVVMIFFGIGDVSKIVMIVVLVVFLPIVAIRDAVVTIPSEYYDVMLSLRATPFDKIRHIAIPAAVPSILTSLRASTGEATSILVVTETYATKWGLGFYIMDSWQHANYVQMYFGIVTLAVMGFVIFLILDVAEKYLCRWKG